MADKPDCIQVVFAFPEHIAELEGWLASRGCRLFRMPDEPDDLPTYGIGPIERPKNLF